MAALRDPSSLDGHQWKVICASIGFQLAFIISQSIEASRPSAYTPEGESIRRILGFTAIVGGALVGGVLGARIDKRLKGRRQVSSVWHLFVLVLLFALIFAVLRLKVIEASVGPGSPRGRAVEPMRPRSPLDNTATMGTEDLLRVTNG